MFGLWFAIAGIFSGAICSYLAKSKNRTPKNWYTLGQIFPIISVVVISLLDTVIDNSENEIHEEKYSSFTDDIPPSLIHSH